MHENARWSTAYKNSLPDSAFFYVDEPCVNRRDAQGRSHPLGCRHFPYKDRQGKISLSHVRNAISRAPQSNLPLRVQREVQAEARRVLARRGGYEREPELQQEYAMAANLEVRIPKMRWKQISGDMDPGTYGGLIAWSDGERIELVEIQPVREYVGEDEASEVGFPFWTNEAWYDSDDLKVSRKEVQHALTAMDIGAESLQEMDPEQRALTIAEALMQYGDKVEPGQSGWSNDIITEDIEWMSGDVAGAQYLSDADTEFRVEILGQEYSENTRRKKSSFRREHIRRNRGSISDTVKSETELAAAIHSAMSNGIEDASVGSISEAPFTQATLVRNGSELAEYLRDQGFTDDRALRFLSTQGSAGIIAFENNQQVVQVVYYSNASDLETDWAEAEALIIHSH